MKVRLYLFAVMLLMLAVTDLAHAAVPALITYQGALTDASGNPANGTYDMTFAMYRRVTGGFPTWSESLSVNVTDGVFTVRLGRTSRLPADLRNCYYLEVQVGGVPMAPRHRLTSVLYSLLAADSEELDGRTGDFYRNASNINAGILREPRLPQNAIDSSEIEDGGITSPDLASACVTADKIAVGAVSANRIRNGAVTAAKIADAAVTGSKIEPGARIVAAAGGEPVFEARNRASTSGSCGLKGQVAGGVGVYGVATTTTGTGIGVRGKSYSERGTGVEGRAFGGGVGVEGRALGGASEGVGVCGYTENPNGIGVDAQAAHESALALKVEGRSFFRGSAQFTERLICDDGADVWGPSTFNGRTTFARPTDFRDKADFHGYATFHAGHGPHADLAEGYPARNAEPADVVVIDADGRLVKCTKERDTAVAGIVSTDPSMMLQGATAQHAGAVPLALVGIVLCKVDATEYPVKAGDLLTTSATPGHAMKALTPRRCVGAIIGKALEDLDSGTGEIQVLVTLR